MPMIKKSISVTNQQDAWIKSQIATGHYGNESEVVRELIRERQLQEQETPAEIEVIRQKLIAAEKAGFTDQTVEEIWSEARQKAKREHD